jgi:gas vesicle protein
VKFLLGFAVGLGLGLIFAPAPGSETLKRITQKARELARIPEQKAAEAADAAKEKAGEMGSRIGRQAAEAAVQSLKDEVLGQKGA